jgi:alpha-glutamyl/putrescinyl thymine pyrophosphorylase-like protein
MPTFCRHNRFLERCPICSKTLPGHSPSTTQRRERATVPSGARVDSTSAGRTRARSMRVQREGRAQDDGYRSELAPGLRASADAERLAQEIAFASGRLLALATAPPGLYGEARELAASELEQATWMCFLIAYLSPLEQEDPFAGIRLAIAAGRPADGGVLPVLAGIPLGPRSSHDPARGAETLLAYRHWVARSGASQAAAFVGDPGWSPQRRFARVFERLALPGFARMGRYELLVMLGRLGLYELRPDSLHLAGARGLSAEDLTTLGAKRVFGIGDPLLLERRAGALAQAAGVPVEALDLALSNWASQTRATLGFPPETDDAGAHERALQALAL